MYIVYIRRRARNWNRMAWNKRKQITETYCDHRAHAGLLCRRSSSLHFALVFFKTATQSYCDEVKKHTQSRKESETGWKVTMWSIVMCIASGRINPRQLIYGSFGVVPTRLISCLSGCLDGSERFVRRRSLVLVVAAKLHKTNRQIAGKPVNAMEKIQSSRSYYYVPERERDEEHEGRKEIHVSKVFIHGWQVHFFGYRNPYSPQVLWQGTSAWRSGLPIGAVYSKK